MAEVAAPPRGVELFASGRRRIPLKISGRRAQALEKLGIRSVQDLLQHYPRHHVDRTQLRTIRDLARLAGEGFSGEVQVHATVRKMERPIRTRSRKVIIKALIGDETGAIGVTWFNQEWIARALTQGTQAFFYGRLGMYAGKLQMTAPRFEVIRTGSEPFNVGRIIPIYPATGDLSSDQLRRIIWEALGRIDAIADPLPDELRIEVGVMSRTDAIRLVHFPETKEDVISARRRLIFDELFGLQLGLVYRKRKLERTVQGIAHPAPGEDSLAEAFVAALPFALTDAQRRACSEVASDMAKAYPMHRLLEGEVGSGKTVVALYGCLLAIGGGRQAAFMAPTEVLAEQHHLTLDDLLGRAFGEAESRNLFASASRRPVVRLLTGSTPAARREEILRGVATGEVDLVVGTHALIQEAVEFRELGVAVVDEQHRFGVHQRKRLREKGVTGEPDVLVMTATPIPRTLAVTIYGDLDVSVLDELPEGRRPITTSIAQGEVGRKHAYEVIRREVAGGRQAFVVYALRDESDKVELRSAKSEARRLAAEVFPDLRVGLVHGDMKSEEKEAAMSAFRDGRTDVLVATTVVEVGVDVPNATVMLIEDADRFGLAQLHQLRGRIGRGRHDSTCVLATDVDLSRASDDPSVALALERLEAVEKSTDGFALAVTDLRQRGEGQLFGARQSGMPELKMARVLRDQSVVKLARDLAVGILEEDPQLRGYAHIALEREMRDRFPEAALDVVQSG
ncbi:MAG: ATP-dependent DNA helicase RecG [Actinomycetota bacterium]|nr:ATP-dependent DNA helicase RecG [Actinomycetota bacterium]